MEAPEDAQILHNLIALKDKELANLKEELEQLDKNARTAAMFGKQLLEQNQELSIEMDRQSKTRETQIEELEQETYALRGKVKELTLANKSQHEDIETLERTLKQEELDKQRHLELEHGARVEELRRQLETTAGEAKEREMRLQEQLQEQQQVAEKLRLQLQVQQNETQHNLTLQCENDELIALQITCNDLRTEKVVLEGKVSTLETAIAKLQGELIHVQKALERREEELESVKIENASSRGQVEIYLN
ncbi:PREDICTED: bicaudal D-related protein 1-like [Priapulus caudatus]|uniref:Bicaudal D-related protein 1-like n=1 Tax=Priapulus caudatus TaxID=37621 RepID=A0ABM1DPL5_PRICU|nr:PREDICTED: bicaudal D-related protein 1-like [Priapulus caudatus]